MLTRNLILVCLAVTLIMGCASTASRQSPRAIFDSLSKDHSGGIPVDVAQKAMQDAGFNCELVLGGTFRHEIQASDAITKKYETHDNIDFLKCKRSTQIGMVSYFDSVALLVENDLVVKILANWGATGP